YDGIHKLVIQFEEFLENLQNLEEEFNERYLEYESLLKEFESKNCGRSHTSHFVYSMCMDLYDLLENKRINYDLDVENYDIYYSQYLSFYNEHIDSINSFDEYIISKYDECSTVSVPTYYVSYEDVTKVKSIQ
ncbi:hypothetical protein GOV06_00730, partial [Candidatus Woesearchaeota archaeon]|nr:hypothetical protein [Candidatus Woesearchaeota archaeon]